jgi:hypothetical protein
MSDNVTIFGGGVGTSFVVCTENLRSSQLQVAKLAWGAIDVDSGNVCMATPLPIQPGTNVTFPTNADAGIGAGTAPSKALVVGGVYNSSLPTLTTGQTAGVQVDSSGRQIVNIGTGISTLATVAKQPALGTAGSASSDVITVQGIASMTPILVTASIASAQTLATVTTVGTVTTLTGSGVASGSADSGNPHKIGGRASTGLSGITLVSDGNRTDFLAAEDGAQYIRPLPAHPSDYFDASPTTITSSTSDTSIQASAGTGKRNYMTGIVIRNSSATATGVIIKDGSGGTAKAHIPVPASGGCTIIFNPPLRGSAATAVYAACQDSVASIYITPMGFASKV